VNKKRRFILRNKYGFTEEEITYYSNLIQGSGVNIESVYISNKKYTELRKYLDIGPWKNIIHNKWISSIYFAQNELPQPKIYGLLEPLFGIDIHYKPLLNATQLEDLIREFDLKKFVLKHIGGGQGDSVFIIKKIERHKNGFVYSTIDKRRFDRRKINELITYQTGYLRGYKIEEFLDLHENINQITGGGTSSLRIYTLREKPNKAQVKLGFIRFGLPDGATDHLSNGAIYASINLKEGKINKGISNVDRTIWISKHQKTGERFVGRVIPFWNKIIQIVERAAQSTPGLNWVGWDVVVTNDGPYLIEGNVGMTLTSFQQTFGGIKENGILEDWIHHLNIPIREGKDKGELNNWKIKYVRSSIRKLIRR